MKGSDLLKVMVSQWKGNLVQPLPTHRAGSWEVWIEPEVGVLGGGRSSWLPELGQLPNSGSEDRKRMRDRGGVSEVERKA